MPCFGKGCRGSRAAMLRVKGSTGKKFGFSMLAGVMFFVAGTHYQCPPLARRELKILPEAGCSKWKPASEILAHSNPRIELNTRKFVLPLLYNGPNNQLWGLRQTAYLAIALNRTLVMPVFRKHFTDESGPREIVDAKHRFQVEALANLISVVDFDEYIRQCGKTVDEVFQAAPLQRWAFPELEVAEKELGLKFLRRSANGDVKVSNPFLPPVKMKSLRNQDGNYRPVKEDYDSDAKCALFVFPFREINMELKRNSWEEDYRKFYQKFKTSLDEVPEWAVVQALHLNTPTPTYVREIAEEFLYTIFGNSSYLAIHWRYDMEDFQKFMCDKEEGIGNPNQAVLCNKVSRITPDALGKAIADHIKSIHQNSQLLISGVYVATPSTASALEFMEKLKTTLISYQIDVITQRDLKLFLRVTGLFALCNFIDENFNEFSSLAEMEICARSAVFLRSSYSSWSDSVIQTRVLWHMKRAMRRFDMTAINLPGLDQ